MGEVGGVRAGDLDDMSGAGQTLSEAMSVLHRQRRVVDTVHDERRAGDLGRRSVRSSRPNSRPRYGASAPSARAFHIAIPPLALDRVGDDQVGDGVGQLVDRTVLEPTGFHLLLPLAASGRWAVAAVSSRISATTRSGASNAAATQRSRPGSCRR